MLEIACCLNHAFHLQRRKTQLAQAEVLSGRQFSDLSSEPRPSLVRVINAVSLCSDIRRCLCSQACACFTLLSECEYVLSKIFTGCKNLIAITLLFNFSYMLGSSEGLFSQNSARTLASGREEVSPAVCVTV